MIVAFDQYGHTHTIPGRHPRKELMERFRVKHAERMYRDTKDGARHVGYVITGLWLELFDAAPWRREP